MCAGTRGEGKRGTRRGSCLVGKGEIKPRGRPGWAAPPKECMLAMDIFCDLEPAAMAAFEQQTEMRTCRKGQILYSQEDRAEVLFLLKRGRVQLYRLTPSGKRLELAVVEPGAFFGEMPRRCAMWRDCKPGWRSEAASSGGFSAPPRYITLHA